MLLRDKLLIYVHNKQMSLENERQEIKDNVRFHAMDDLDYFELYRSKIRIDAWNEFMHELCNILLYCK